MCFKGKVEKDNDFVCETRFYEEKDGACRILKAKFIAIIIR